MTDKKHEKKFERNSKKTRELNLERRNQSAFERLGSTQPACVLCGEKDPHVLEKHHFAGRAFDEGTVHVCRNHHRKLSNLQKDYPAQITEIPDPLEIIAHVLLNLADFFEFLIEKFREFAKELLERANVNSLNVEGAAS